MLELLILAASSMTKCPVERAHYALRHRPNWTAYYRQVDSAPDWPGNVALAIHDHKAGKTFWWLPWPGGTDGLQNIASTNDITSKDWHPPNPDIDPRPYGNRQYLGFDAHYNLINRIPQVGAAAPAHMLFPDSAGSGDKVFVWKDFFDLTSCARKGGNR